MVRWLQFCKCFSWIIQQSINKDGIDKVGVTEAGRPIVIEVELWWSSPSLSLTTLTSELWWLWSKLWIPQQTAWEYCFATSPLLISYQESKAIIASPGGTDLLLTAERCGELWQLTFASWQMESLYLETSHLYQFHSQQRPPKSISD